MKKSGLHLPAWVLVLLACTSNGVQETLSLSRTSVEIQRARLKRFGSSPAFFLSIPRGGDAASPNNAAFSEDDHEDEYDNADSEEEDDEAMISADEEEEEAMNMEHDDGIDDSDYHSKEEIDTIIESQGASDVEIVVDDNEEDEEEEYAVFGEEVKIEEEILEAIHEQQQSEDEMEARVEAGPTSVEDIQDATPVQVQETTIESSAEGVQQIFMEERFGMHTTDGEMADAYDEGETTAAGDYPAVDVSTLAAAVGASSDDSSFSAEDDNNDTPLRQPNPSVVKSLTPAAATTEISEDMKQVLIRKLRYKRHDVKSMRPDIAAFVVANDLRRPIEGMPKNWYIAGKVPVKTSSLRSNLVKIGATLAVIVGAAVAKQGGISIDSVGSIVGSTTPRLRESSAVFASSRSCSGPSVPTVSITPVQSPIEEAESSSESESVEEKEQNHPSDDKKKPHSLKPFSEPEDLDKTWLDKGITKVENAIKAFFNIRI